MDGACLLGQMIGEQKSRNRYLFGAIYRLTSFVDDQIEFHLTPGIKSKQNAQCPFHLIR